MQDAIKDIIRGAAARGACRLTDTVSDIASLVGLFFSPQGKEFCQNAIFPTLEMFHRLDKGYDLSKFGVYVNSGEVSASNRRNIALIGETRAALSYDGVACKYTIILMHGGKATIKARNYAVLEVVNVGSEVEYDTDETVILL